MLRQTDRRRLAGTHCLGTETRQTGRHDRQAGKHRNRLSVDKGRGKSRASWSILREITWYGCTASTNSWTNHCTLANYGYVRQDITSAFYVLLSQRRPRLCEALENAAGERWTAAHLAMISHDGSDPKQYEYKWRGLSLGLSRAVTSEIERIHSSLPANRNQLTINLHTCIDGRWQAHSPGRQSRIKRCIPLVLQTFNAKH